MKNEEDTILKDILETVTFIKDNAVSKKEFVGLESKVSKIQSDVTKIQSEVTKVQSEMVTKEYLDDKLDDLEAKIGGRITRRAEHENKFKHELVSVMKRNSLLDAKDLKQLERAI